jgi:hypothetical protein
MANGSNSIRKDADQFWKNRHATTTTQTYLEMLEGTRLHDRFAELLR